MDGYIAKRHFRTRNKSRRNNHSQPSQIDIDNMLKIPVSNDFYNNNEINASEENN